MLIKSISVLILSMFILLHTSVAQAQTYGSRPASKNGELMLPVPTNHLWSTGIDHIGRESVEAWDIGAAIGTPVFPVSGGIVEYAGCNNRGGYGCWLFINHGTFRTIMAHCKTGSISVASGNKVSEWTKVCEVGMTGSTSGPHVHLEIHRLEGGRTKLDSVFDSEAMWYCKFCRTDNNPKADIPNSPFVSVRSALNGSTQGLPIIFAYPFILLVFGALMACYVLSSRSKIVRFGVYHGIAMYSIVVTSLLFLVPAGVNMNLGNGFGSAPRSLSPDIPQGEVWDVAYSQMAKWEGSKCTKDPVRTYKGVTQITYNRYRRDQNVGRADVCSALTTFQAKDIYFRYYWVNSGAAKIAKTSPKLAVTYFDMAVNAGNGVPRKFYAACGANVICFNDMRESFYKSAGGCALYCAGWLNRLADIRTITE